MQMENKYTDSWWHFFVLLSTWFSRLSKGKQNSLHLQYLLYTLKKEQNPKHYNVISTKLVHLAY